MSTATVLHTGEVDASPPAGQDQELRRITTAHVLLGLALAVAWFLAYLLQFSGFEQNHDQSQLYGQLRAELAEGTAPTGAPIAPGEPIAVLSIPALGLENEVVVEGSRPEQLKKGPGHVLGSVLPGQHGVSILAGRYLTYGAPFRDIDLLPSEARVDVTTAQGAFTYRVTGIRRDGDKVPAAPAEGAGRLTLITAATKSGLLGGFRPSETVYVDTVLEEGAVAPGRLAAADTADHLTGLSWDPGPLVLALQLLGVAIAGMTWAWLRWSRSAAWLAGGPVVLASAWVVASQLGEVLPALV